MTTYDNPFIVQQPQQGQQQQQQGMSPLQGLNMYQQFTGGEGGGMFGGGGATGGEAGLGGEAAAGSGGKSFLASAGPWAALAAAIIANESEAKRGGYRDEDKGDYAKDLAGGKVLEQDMSKRWIPKLFGEDLEHDDLGLGGDTLASADLLTLDFSNAWDTFKNKGILSKIF